MQDKLASRGAGNAEYELIPEGYYQTVEYRMSDDMYGRWMRGCREEELALRLVQQSNYRANRAVRDLIVNARPHPDELNRSNDDAVANIELPVARSTLTLFQPAGTAQREGFTGSQDDPVYLIFTIPATRY